MKLKVVHMTMAAAAAALLIAGCGGGGGGAGAQPDTSASLALGGTAATGAALAGASVEVKCASGSGTATTSTAGVYTVTIDGGTLPCIIKVSGTSSSGTAVTLHSVAAPAAAGADGNTTVVANVTPITEMIVAQLTAAMPADSFATFNPAQITTTAVATATTAIVTALKDAGLDLAAIDPLQGTLVAGSTASTYDVLLDQLGTTVPPESLPMLVTQIAESAATSTTGSLDVLEAAVAGDALPGCPVAVSGRYRTIDYTGAMQLHTVDFKANTILTEGNSAAETLVPSTTQACQFAVGSTQVVIGPQGAGAVHDAETVGYFFPVQSHALSSIVGTWNYLESGLNEVSAGEHWIGQFAIAADGAVALCDYNLAAGVSGFGTCTPDTETMSIRAEADGSFTVQAGADTAKVYGYRSPNGALNLFGTSNPTGSTSTTAWRTHFVMTKPGALGLPAVGAVSKYWDLILTHNGSTLATSPFTADTQTVTAVDSAASTVTRQRSSDGRVDTVKVNHPVEGLRFRAASTGISSFFQLQIPSLGISTAVDNMPGHFISIGVARP